MTGYIFMIIRKKIVWLLSNLQKKNSNIWIFLSIMQLYLSWIEVFKINTLAQYYLDIALAKFGLPVCFEDLNMQDISCFFGKITRMV
ncbi:hypothetical protein HMP0721_1084 [Pseudoramibacter alactolyticus ATCC 23263]|uniref:Uncharacterized protein n=1 Tax=Pseudoramibacter alactolyticus ATCC 23263 TaxID=887929 RepID=E6MGF1_9FIRM|nr:hypothetical protein HMP0721_1084 [Pseudoramibacter alactolyticus ATCC 23263]